MIAPITNNKLTGLTANEVRERISSGKINTVTYSTGRSYWLILFSNIFTTYNLFLFFAFGVLIARGETRDVFFAGVLLLINVVVNLVQDIRAKYSLDKLTNITVHEALLVRDGETRLLPINQIVQDDIIELIPGQPVVVDGHIVRSERLEMNEASLTGESDYFHKQVGDEVHSGSYCVAGKGWMRAERIGSRNSLHHLMKTAKKEKMNLTPIQKWLDAILKLLLIIIIIFGPLTIFSGILKHLPLTEVLKNMVTVVSSLFPQGLILSVTLSFTYGAIRIARQNALIQQINAVESMGHTSILCLDKTGTLTTNQLKVQEIIATDDVSKKELTILLRKFIAASSWKNKTLLAIEEATKRSTTDPHKLYEVPFSSQRKWSGISFSRTQHYILSAPENLPLTTSVKKQIHELTITGLRVLVFAHSLTPLSIHKEKIPLDTQVIAIIALIDEVRPTVKETLNEIKKMNIQIKIISGDGIETLRSIALQVGWKHPYIISGPELETMSRKDFDTCVMKTNVFGRITPELKQKLIMSLNRHRQYVMMIGDGVNDVPALKQAKVAVVMNDSAQIAKDVSDVILLDNSFTTLVKAIREGRTITQIIYAIAAIYFVKIVYLLVLFFITVFTNLPFTFSIPQTTWITFTTVGLPTLLIAFRILHSSYVETHTKHILNYSLLTGTIGGLVMILLNLFIFQLSHHDVVTSRTFLTIFSCMFGSIVVADILFPSIPNNFNKSHDMKNLITIGLLTLFSLFAPVYIFPDALGFFHFRPIYWILLFELATVTYIIIHFLNKKFRNFIH